MILCTFLYPALQMPLEHKPDCWHAVLVKARGPTSTSRILVIAEIIEDRNFPCPRSIPQSIVRFLSGEPKHNWHMREVGSACRSGHKDNVCKTYSMEGVRIHAPENLVLWILPPMSFSREGLLHVRQKRHRTPNTKTGRNTAGMAVCTLAMKHRVQWQLEGWALFHCGSSTPCKHSGWSEN